MPTLETLLIFAALSLGLAATPGPNMLYLVSRSLAQGVGAGMISLIGCQCGSLLIMLCAAAGITAALFAIPYAWDVLRIGGAAYLAFLAWQCLRPGGQPIFAARPMPREPASRLFGVGFAAVQIAIAIIFDGLLIYGAAGVSRFLSENPTWMAAQRWILGGALALIAIKLATESRA
jgi:threonine/homoserine/homoserine lactone efflux protein